jgi:hypothetical protein
MVMRTALLVSVVLAITLGANQANAGPRVISVDPTDNAPTTAADFQKYHGFMYNLSEYAGRKDLPALEDNLKHQLDMVENVGLSPRVLEFFRSIPIIATDTDCLEMGAAAACYGPIAPSRAGHTHAFTVWDSESQKWTNPDIVDLAADTHLGVVMLRPTMTQYSDDPILLHEFLHAYHARLMPNGFDNLGIKGYYADAKAKDVFEKKAYTLFNDREFFAITASIFLAGKESIHEPKTRAVLKEKLPDYYKYLVGVFGFDPEPKSEAPVASAAPTTPVASAAAATN